VIQPDLTDYGHITFLFSTVRWESEYTPYELGYVRTTTNEEYKLKYRNLYEGVSDRELLLLNDAGYKRSTHHITAMVPVKNTDQRTKAIICVQRQMDDIRNIQMGYVSRVIETLLMLAAFEITGVGLYLSEQLIKPVTKITEEASRFARENETAKKKLTDSIRGQDEIGVLAQSIDRMEEQITDYMQHLTTVTAEKERISTELNVAKQIQADMLPSVFPAFPDHDDFDIFATMTPAKEVGGDFYDFFLVDDDHLAMVMADVSGKGVPAALFMVITKTLIKNRAQMGDSPAEILFHVNNQLCDGNETEMFVTVWMAIL
jgi:sigma-B regulation protein RsbU (phosphoserine phosphatase)